MDKKSRRSFLVNKRFQGIAIIQACVVIVAVAFAVTVLTLHANKGSTTVALEHAKVVVKSTPDFIFPSLLQIGLVVVLVSAITVGVLVLMITHRIAGPAYRMRHEVDLLNKGVYSVSFKLRARDELKDLAGSLSVLASGMKKRHDYLRVKVAQLKEAVRAGDSKAAGLLVEDIESTL